MRKYVTAEEGRRLPRAGYKIVFLKWWFARAWHDRKQPWRYQRSNYFMKTRGANYAQAWLGPVTIMWPRRWLAGPARQLHKKVFRGETGGGE